jgi:hypothetical protein
LFCCLQLWLSCWVPGCPLLLLLLLLLLLESALTQQQLPSFCCLGLPVTLLPLLKGVEYDWMCDQAQSCQQSHLQQPHQQQQPCCLYLAVGRVSVSWPPYACFSLVGACF